MITATTAKIKIFLFDMRLGYHPDGTPFQLSEWCAHAIVKAVESDSGRPPGSAPATRTSVPGKISVPGTFVRRQPHARRRWLNQ